MLVARRRDDASRVRADVCCQVLGPAEEFPFPTHTMIVHSARAPALRLQHQRLQRLCAVKRFCQRRPDDYCQSVKRIYQRRSQDDAVPPGEGERLKSYFFLTIQQLFFSVVIILFFKEDEGGGGNENNSNAVEEVGTSCWARATWKIMTDFLTGTKTSKHQCSSSCSSIFIQ